MKRPALLAFLASHVCIGAAAEVSAHWLRDAAISPDGRSIVFRSDGDLYVSSVRTGQTRALRATARHETSPVWLPNGTDIAFAADEFGNYDVFMLPADGSGEPRRLTWHPYDEMPVGAAPDGRSVLVRSARVDVTANPAIYIAPFEGAADFTHGDHSPAIFAQPVAGGAPHLLLEPPVYEAAADMDGARIAFSVRSGAEHIFRKHERSPATWDIWLREADGTVRQLTQFNGHDTSPAWNRADGKLYYLSERSGSLNVWRMSVDGEGSAEPVTRHVVYPVRDLTVSATGVIAYSYRGELYAGTPQAMRKLPIRLPRSSPRAAPGAQADFTDQIQEARRVPGTGALVVVARGEVYAVDESLQRRQRLFPKHAGAKSAPSFSADGRRLLVVRDAGAKSDLLLAELPAGARSWLDGTATVRSIEPAGHSTEVILRAALAPDGARAAFASGTALHVIEIGQSQARTLLNRSEGFGPPVFVWHPDGRHLALQWLNRQRIQPEIAVLDIATRALVNISSSGFEDTAPQWSRDGRVLVYVSDRDGLRNFQLSGGTLDAYGFFFDERAQRAHERGIERLAVPARADEMRDWLSQMRMAERATHDRRVRLSPTSTPLTATALAPSGRFLMMLQQSGEAKELWLQPFPEGDARRVARFSAEDLKDDSGAARVDSMDVSLDEREVLVSSKGRVFRVQLDNGVTTRLELKGMPAVDTPAVHRWIFEHVVRTVPADFYLPESLPRLRWSEHVAEYRRHVAAVTHPADFAELMGELLGELNASHTYFHYRRPPPPEQPAFSLGVVYAPDHEGPGWKIADVLHSGPLSKADPEIRAGDVIVQVDSVPVAARSDPARFLTRAPDAEIELTVRTAAGAERRLRVSPLDTAGESRLFYRRWLQFQARETDRLSGGRVGYVHMPAMEEEWFRPVVEDVLGSLVHKEALLLDTRFNSGGWIHEPLISFLAAPFAFDLRVRGTTYASEPALRAGRTFVVLVNRANYSNGFETPRLLREQGIARLVGEPMAGTGLGGSTDPLPYPEYSYSVAHDVTLTRAGELWEGVEQQPDVLAPADRNALRAGHDVQLAAAVQAVLADAQRKVAKGCEMGDPVYGCSNASPWLSEAQRDGISRTGVSRAH